MPLNIFVPTGDLAEIFESNGYKFLSVFVDLFSRKIWVKPMKVKTAANVMSALKEVLDDGVEVQTLSTDQGKEYIAAESREFYDKHDIRYVLKTGFSKAYMAEHMIYVLKKRLFILMRSSGQSEWEKLVGTVARNWNNSACPAIGGLVPSSINATNEEDVRLARQKMPKAHFVNWEEQQKNIREFKETLDSQPFHIGDCVYLIGAKNALDKSHDT